MSVEAASRSIAVTFSGWLNVTIPDAGRDARRFLVEPLGADVFVAGTFLPTDCATARDGRCLLERLKHLQPLTSVDLAPMLTHDQLHRHALSAPAFGPISRNLKVRELFNGLNLFAPVLGNPNVSCMRELHDLHRVWALVRAHEAGPRGGAEYRRIVFSRLEFRWLAPHPPLPLLEPQVLWVPSGQNVNGVNDRHAVMHRDHAPTYFGRWQFLLSDQLLRRIDLVTATHIGPEQLLGLVLEQARPPIRPGFFPNVAYLACCDAAHRCFAATRCHSKPSRQGCFDPQAEGPRCARARRDAVRDEPRCRPASAVLAAPAQPAHGRGCFPMRGKYWDEMHDAVLHWRYLQCAAPRYWPLPRQLATLWGWPPRLMLVVAAGRRWVDPIGGHRAVDRGYATRHVILDHASRPGLLRGAERARGACPVSLAAPRAAQRVPLAGYCRNTDGEGDCSRGDAGAWETRKHALTSLQACVAKCRGCARCTVVSFSRLQHDCSWYHRCHEGGASTSSPAAAHALDAERLVNVESGWDYVTVRVRLPPSLSERGNGAEGQVAMRHRRSFPGAVTASGLVQLGPRHNGTA